MGGRQGVDQCGESEEWILMNSDPAGDWKALNLFPVNDSHYSREVQVQPLFFHFIPHCLNSIFHYSRDDDILHAISS